MRQKNVVRRLAAAPFLWMLCLLFLSWPVSANSPAPAFDLPLWVEGELPEGAVYADLLAPLPEGDGWYTPLNQEHAAARGWDENTPIVQYKEDGFVSLTFHMKDSRLTESLAQAESGPLYFVDWWSFDELQLFQEKCPQMKAALLDEDGNILLVSDAADIGPDRSGYMTGLILDAGAGTLEASWYTGYSSAPSSPAGHVLRIVLSVAAEVLLALAFRIPKVWKVALVNLGTQAFLTAFMLLVPLSYPLLVLIGEAVVYAAEFALYRLLYRSLSWKRALAYTLTANTVTLAAGLVIDVLFY